MAIFIVGAKFVIRGTLHGFLSSWGTEDAAEVDVDRLTDKYANAQLTWEKLFREAFSLQGESIPMVTKYGFAKKMAIPAFEEQTGMKFAEWDSDPLRACMFFVQEMPLSD